MFLASEVSTVHAVPTYTLSLSTSRILEANSPGVTLTLTVSNANAGTIYGFTWNITDPSGGVTTFLDGGSPTTLGVLTLTSVYPRDFSGASVTYNGTYLVNIFQFRPGPPVPVAMGKFFAGLTDSLSYQRTEQVSILAQGYASGENVTVRMFHAGTLVTGFPSSRLADGMGIFSFPWAIPVSAPLGNYNVSLSGQMTTKQPRDSQTITISPTNVSISQLTTSGTISQGSETEMFSFTALYPDGTQAKTGNATIQIIEPDGITTHQVTAYYNSTVGVFEGKYRVSSSSPTGAWIAVVNSNTFNDGYGNVGPSTFVERGFVVQPATSLTVTYILLVAVFVLGAALTIFVSWLYFFGRKKVQRNVLKVDFQSIEREASRVENRDFFVKVQEQLKQRQQTKPEGEAKDG